MDKIVVIITVVFLLFSVSTTAFAHTLDDSDRKEGEIDEERKISETPETTSTNQLTIEVNNEDRGTTVPVPGTYEYPVGEEVTITAQSYADYTFEGWTGDREGGEEEINLTMDEDKEITANFEELEIRELEIETTPGGTTDPLAVIPKHYYDYGEEVTVEADPLEGFEFDEWEVNGETYDEKEITLEMTEDKTAQANFQSSFVCQLEIDVEGEGTTDPIPTIDPPGDLVDINHVYMDGEEATVEAIPDPGWEFDEWTGDVPAEQENDPEITITMDDNKEITANFEEVEMRELEIDVESNFPLLDGGTTIPRPTIDLIDSHDYPDGEEVTIEAYPWPGDWEFDEWTGDYESTDKEIMITMDEDKEITANFYYPGVSPPDEPDLWEIHQLDIDIEGRGMTQPTSVYPHYYLDTGDGVEADVTAIDDLYPSWEFTEWTDDYESTDKDITIDMDDDKEITANFELIEWHDLDIEATVGGTTNPVPSPTDFASHTYKDGAEVTVEAIPSPGYEFDKWDGDVPADQEEEPEITITMEEDKDLTAEFEEVDVHQLDIDVETESAPIDRAGGTTSPLPAVPQFYFDGEKETLRAIPNLGASFEGWDGEVPENKEEKTEIDITMDSDKSIIANFETPEPVADLGDDRTVDEEEIMVFVNDQEVGLYQYEWDFGDGTKIPFGPPMITHNYSQTGTYTVELTVRDILGREDTDEITITVEEGEGTDILLIDWLTDQGVKGANEIGDLMPDIRHPGYDLDFEPPPLLTDEVERNFWNEINSKDGYNIITRPPVYQEPTMGGESYDIEDYLEKFDPEIVILSDNFLNAEGRWNLDKTQRLALVDHLEDGNSLMATGGSLNDLRMKTPEAETQIGQWNHTNRLHLDEAESIDEVLENYRSSLTATMGLGLFPLYQEGREWVGMALEEMYENVDDPYTKAALFAASTIAYSVPLLPANVPFESEFSGMETDSEITEGLGDEFELDLLNRYTKGEESPIENITGETNLTSAGWQLQYPFLMAQNMINRTSENDFLLNDVQNSLKENLSFGAESMNQLFDHPFTQYDFDDRSFVDESPLTSEDLRNVTENITDSLLQFLEDMHGARTDIPSQIELDINFTVGDQTIDETIAIPIPVPLQKLFRPAEIATTSEDGRAAVLKYEMDGQRYEFDPEISWDPPSPSDFTDFDQIRDSFPEFDPVDEIPISYRTAYFTFNPSLGEDNSMTIVENTLEWLAEAPEPEAHELIGSMGVPEDLVEQTREHLPEELGEITENRSMLLQKEEKHIMDISVEEVGSLQLYWSGAEEVALTLSHDEKDISVDPQRYDHGDYRSAFFELEESGDWTLEAEVNAEGLKTPMMAQTIEGEVEEVPDIVVDDFAVDPVYGEVPLDVEITAEIENEGDAEGEIDLLIEDEDGEPVDSWTYDLEADEFEEVSETYEFDETGEYEIILGDETRTVTVVEEADLEVIDFTVPEKVEEGDTETIEATIENHGGEELTVFIYVDGVVEEEKAISEGQEETLETDYTFDEIGEVEIEIKDERDITLAFDTVEVVEEIEQYSIEIDIAEGEGTIEVEGVEVDVPFEDEYDEGDQVTIKAIPEDDYEFDY